MQRYTRVYLCFWIESVCLKRLIQIISNIFWWFFFVSLTSDGFYGLKCENDIDICQFSSDLCKNNGTCVDGHGSSFHCICANSFTGPICDVNVVNLSSQCLSEPCKNGGTCKEKVNGTYKCSCTDGHTGHNCETKSGFEKKISSTFCFIDHLKIKLFFYS